jgi:hypothetical protein
MKTNQSIGKLASAALLITMSPAFGQSPDLGLFSNHGDIGSVLKPGSAEFDSAKGAYLVGGGGENMWFTNDAFHFVWKQMSGDVALSANIRWIGTDGNAHRKACLILRQTLEPNSAYADAVLHGNGLACLQYREAPDAQTREIQSSAANPARLCIQRRGAYVSLYIAAPGETLHPAGGSFRIQLNEPFYLGLGVCAHDNNRLEQAEFSNVKSPLCPPTRPSRPQSKAPSKSSRSPRWSAGSFITRATTSKRRIGRRTASICSSIATGESINCRRPAANRA